MDAKKHAKVPKSDTKAWLAGLNRAILDCALDCIITMDATGHVVEFNPAAERTFGYAGRGGWQNSRNSSFRPR
jgi:PAS domain-containing protein